MARRVSVTFPAQSGLLANLAGCLLVQTARETSGAAVATYRLWDGTGTDGRLIVPVGLPAGASVSDNFYRCVMPFRQGLFYELVAGAVEGAATVLIDHDCENWFQHVEEELLALIGGG